MNLLENAPNQSSKFRTKNRVEINDNSRKTYNINSQNKSKVTMQKSSLCNYSDAYMLIKGTITVTNIEAAFSEANNTYKVVICKNYVKDSMQHLQQQIMPIKR